MISRQDDSHHTSCTGWREDRVHCPVLPPKFMRKELRQQLSSPNSAVCSVSTSRHPLTSALPREINYNCSLEKWESPGLFPLISPLFWCKYLQPLGVQYPLLTFSVGPFPEVLPSFSGDRIFLTSGLSLLFLLWVTGGSLLNSTIFPHVSLSPLNCLVEQVLLSPTSQEWGRWPERFSDLPRIAENISPRA